MRGDFVLRSRVAEEREWSGGVAASQKTQKCAFLYPWVSPVVATTRQTYKTKRVNVEIKKARETARKGVPRPHGGPFPAVMSLACMGF